MMSPCNFFVDILPLLFLFTLASFSSLRYLFFSYYFAPMVDLLLLFSAFFTFLTSNIFKNWLDILYNLFHLIFFGCLYVILSLLCFCVITYSYCFLVLFLGFYCFDFSLCSSVP